MLDRRTGNFIRFTRTAGGATIAPEEHIAAADAHDAAGVDWDTAVEESELLSADGADFDREEFLSGASSPVLFTSAALNFGVNQLLDVLVGLAPAPDGGVDVDGIRRAVDARFPRSCSRCRPGWTPRTGTASPMRGCIRAPSSAARCSPTRAPGNRSSPSTPSRCSGSSAGRWTPRGPAM